MPSNWPRYTCHIRTKALVRRGGFRACPCLIGSYRLTEMTSRIRRGPLNPDHSCRAIHRPDRPRGADSETNATVWTT